VTGPRLTIELDLETLGRLPDDSTKHALIAMFRRQQRYTGPDRYWERERLRRQYIRTNWRNIPWIAQTLAEAEQHRREAAADRHTLGLTQAHEAAEKAGLKLEKKKQ